MGKVRGLLLQLWLLLLLSGPAWACLWYYGKNVKGEQIAFTLPEGTPERMMKYLTENEEHARALGADTSKEPGSGEDFKVRSDYAATLVHQGKSPRAIPILESIEKDHPGEYVVAVNLGTAYELSGENEKALHWIREGIRRNPDSHMGTEWLHEMILEAKIAAAKNPHWAKTHTVLNLDFGSGEVPAMPAGFPSGKDAVAVRKALYYQLHERLAFVPPPDPLVASMIADLADLCGLQMSADHAVALYDLALRYQPARADVIARRRAQAVKFTGQIVSQSALHEKRVNAAMGLAGVMMLGAVTLYIIKKLRNPKAPVRSDT
jgi:hypothetical protein